MSLSYNGHDLESIAICGDPQISIFNFQPEFKDMKSRNGSLFVGTKLGASTVEFTIFVTGSASERRAKLSTLGLWLMVDEPKPLILPETPDRYYLAVPNGSFDMQRGYDGEYTQLKFTLADPIAYSIESHSVTSVNGVATLNVSGNTKTYFTLANVDGQLITPCYEGVDAEHWGITDGDTSMVYDLRTTYSGEITIDTEKRMSRYGRHFEMPDHQIEINWYTLVPTLDSSWIELQPGANTITRTIGDGEFTIEWRDRWY